MIQGLVVTHGALGAELVRVVESIAGPVEGLTAFSNQGRSALDLTVELQERLAAADAGLVLFIDDYGGSCANAAQLACRDKTRAVILCGVNLAMLLGFITWRDSFSLEELARRLVDKGREAIARVGMRGRD
jgi:mannose/fructose-specific phosphotransferase system component IIA